MHPEAQEWLVDALYRVPWREVYDFGSLDINGSVKKILGPRFDVVGIDHRPGPGVDVVSLAHEFAGEPRPIVTSLEMLEHDPYWQLSVATMWKHATGCLVITCAGPGRRPHRVETSPVPGHYGNVGREELAGVLVGLGAEDLVVGTRGNDTMALAWRRRP